MRYPALVTAAAAESADQESNPKSDRGGRVGALLDGRAQEVAGFAGTFPDRFRGVGSGFLRLAVEILHGTFCLPRLALDLHLHVTGRASESLFHLATNILGGAANAIVSHWHNPPEICSFNGRSGCRFLPARTRHMPVLEGENRSSGAGKLAILLPVPLLLAYRSFHSEADRENSQRQKRNEPAPA